ncbi:tubulin glycylase 3A-like [Sitophilus oryzae]|uniref:Tubulin glycylase 3A-like n=1 Tax=Sitophilus oryzae TaxID=7048 RepID=A0A6J2YE11_SITOR|nr:tubulin glycylase 3A-like [Sitophilus oryzae]
MSTEPTLNDRVQEESKIFKVIENCREVVQKNSFALKQSSREPISNAALENIARDMAYVLLDLKKGIKLIKSNKTINSNTNVLEEIENTYKQQEMAKSKMDVEQQNAKKQTNNNNNKNNKQTNQNKQPVANKNNKAQPRIEPGNSQRNRSKSLDSKFSGNNKVVATNVTNMTFPQEKSSTSRNTQPKNNSNDNRPHSSPQPSLKKRSASIPPSREIYNPLGIIKDEVARAIRDRKTFTIKGFFPAVRRALLKRGWIERFHPSLKEINNNKIKEFYHMNLTELVGLLKNKEISETVKKLIKSKLLSNNQVDLYWDNTYDVFKDCPDNKKLTLINQFRREAASYTSKQGLCQAARDAHWLQIPGVAKINHPRCYLLCKGGDTKYFVKDFGLTAAMSLLKWIVKNNVTGECKIASSTGKIPMSYFDFALTECYKYVKREKHQDIDEDIREALENEWHEFLKQFYKAVHVGNHFKLPDDELNAAEVVKTMVRKTTYVLNEIRDHMPCFDMDGYMNIWILKPTNSSRGEGIHICRTLEYILEVVRKNPNRRYIIQKYIERPFLIHDTKFDIRQWFLVSNSSPLTIWMYKLCYLRFSSQTYNLNNLHESIHLTNNSVQTKYHKKTGRDPLIPAYCMWDSKEFKNYLSNIGYPDIYENVIYPGMKECITAAMIAHRDKIDKRKNCFELYGADFMLTESFQPWLLEINSNPALHASTPLMSRMCPDVLEDVIKVVVDNARNNRADTGNFELVYKDKLEYQKVNAKAQFEVTGSPLTEDFCDVAAKTSSHSERNSFKQLDPSKALLHTGENMKNALKNLLKIIKYEKHKRRTTCKEQSIEVRSMADINISTQTNSEIQSLYQITLAEESSEYSVIIPDLRKNT